MSVTIDPTQPPNSQTPRQGAQRIRDVESAFLAYNSLSNAIVDALQPFDWDTATGLLTLQGGVQGFPTDPMGIAPKRYVDNLVRVGLTTGGPNTYALAVTLGLGGTVLDPHALWVVTFNQTNTGLVNLNVNAVGNKAILKMSGGPVQAGDLPQNVPVLLAYNAALGAFVLLNYDPNALLRTGGTMTGALTLAANPTTALQAAPKQYVDASAAATALALKAYARTDLGIAVPVTTINTLYPVCTVSVQIPNDGYAYRLITNWSIYVRPVTSSMLFSVSISDGTDTWGTSPLGQAPSAAAGTGSAMAPGNYAANTLKTLTLHVAASDTAPQPSVEPHYPSSLPMPGVATWLEAYAIRAQT